MNPAYDATQQRLRALHDQKGGDYAQPDNPYSNFEEAAAAAGITVDQGFAYLIGVKQARLKQLLASGKAPNNESVADSLDDLANYATLRASYPTWLNLKAQAAEPEWDRVVEAAWNQVIPYRDAECGNCAPCTIE